MTGGVGILGTESRSESIYVLECKSISLYIQLSAYGQVYRLTEEVLGVIHFAVFCLRYIVHIQSGHLEHLTGTLTVTAGDQRSMHIDKSSLHEEGMDRISDQGSDTEHCLESIGTCSQMRDGTQILKGMTLFL